MEYAGVVYDLDGTLVRLNVDWEQARLDTAAALREAGARVDGESLWELLEYGQREGFEAVVERTIAAHERDGARTSERLALADDLPLSVPTAVCSLNCEAACRVALETHRLDGHVDAIVGRDTVATQKPDPEPLLEAADRIGTPPGRTLFIGDSDRDAITAERAGVPFRYVD